MPTLTEAPFRRIETTRPLGTDSGGSPSTKVLVAVGTAEQADGLVHAGAALARRAEAELLVVHVVRVPPQLPLSEGQRFRSQARPILQAVSRMREHILDVPLRLVVPTGRRVPTILLTVAARSDVHHLVLGWRTRRRCALTGASVTDEVLRYTPCDVLVVRRRPDRLPPGRLLLAVRPRNPRVRTIAAAVALAREHNVPVRIVTVLPTDVARHEEIDTRMWLARVEGLLADVGVPSGRLDRTVINATGLADALREEVFPDDLVVLGAPTGGLFSLRPALGRLPDDLPDRLPTTTVLHHPPAPTFRQRLRRLLRRGHAEAEPDG